MAGAERFRTRPPPDRAECLARGVTLRPPSDFGVMPKRTGGFSSKFDHTLRLRRGLLPWGNS